MRGLRVSSRPGAPRGLARGPTSSSGSTAVYLHNVGRNQDEFIDAFAAGAAGVAVSDRPRAGGCDGAAGCRRPVRGGCRYGRVGRARRRGAGRGVSGGASPPPASKSGRASSTSGSSRRSRSCASVRGRARGRRRDRAFRRPGGTAPRRRTPMDGKTTTRPLIAAGVLLGVGLGGFVDGIVFHQILQLHNMLSGPASSRGGPPDRGEHRGQRRSGTALFHAFTWPTTAPRPGPPVAGRWSGPTCRSRPAPSRRLPGRWGGGCSTWSKG